MQDNFLEEETRNGYLISSGMKKVWAREIAMYQKFYEVCQKYNLKVWADGGTLLGVVRDKGFIPWDDDIDLAMLRDDYDKLISLPQEEFAPYFMQTAYTDVDFVRGHAQLRDSSSTGILPREKDLRLNQGLFIDIFVYDAVPDSKIKAMMQKTRAQFLRHVLEKMVYPSVSVPARIFSCLVTLLSLFFSFKTIYSWFENSFRKVKISDNRMVSSNMFNFFNLKKIIRDKHVYDDTIMMDFEWIKMPVPKGYDSILRTQYGEYMTPVKAPTIHGGTIILDAERPYTEVLAELRQQK